MAMREAATSASILDLLSALSVAMSASSLDLLILEAAISASTSEGLMSGS